MYSVIKGVKKKYYFIIEKETGTKVSEQKRFSKSKKKELRKWLKDYSGKDPLNFLLERYNDKYYSSISIPALRFKKVTKYNLNKNISHFKDKSLVSIIGKKSVEEDSVYEITGVHDLGKKKDVLALCGATLLLSKNTDCYKEKRKINLFDGDTVRIYSGAIKHNKDNIVKSKIEVVSKFIEVDSTIETE